MTAGRIIAGLLCCWLVLGAAIAPGQDSATKSDVRKVVATATATAYVKPDGARLTFVVTTVEGTDKSAREANEKQVKKVKDALAALPLGKLDVETNVLPTSISNLANTPQTAAAARTLFAKRARSVFEVTVNEKDADKLQDAVRRLSEAATDSGATGLDDDERVPRIRLPRGGFGGAAVEEPPEPVAGPAIEWVTSGGKEARRQAIKQATKDAMDDAQAAAGDVTLKVLEIHVNTTDEMRQLISLRGMASQTSGRIPIRVSVTVTCTY
jgi:uncharacterized protein YggE